MYYFVQHIKHKIFRDSDIYSADTSDDEFEKDDDNKIDSLVVKQFNTNNPDRLFNSNDEKFNTDESRSSSRHSAKNENIRYRESNNINNEDSRSDDDLIRKNVRIHSNESVEYVADEVINLLAFSLFISFIVHGKMQIFKQL